MSNEDVTNRLTAMLGTGTAPEAAAEATTALTSGDEVKAGIASGALDMNRYTGRGPTGRLRNFGAMNDTKLVAVYHLIADEGNDAEAFDKIEEELLKRGMPLDYAGRM